MMLRYSLNRDSAASLIESAVDRVLSSGARTPDIARSGDEVIGTKEMGKRICSAMKAI
jgi:3-isopropylmalate dehydrogenase